jgi:MraZ protein
MFGGSYSNTVDDKSRVAVPARLRHLLGGNVVVTRGLDRCLSIYTPESWADYKSEYVVGNNMLSREARQLKRLTVGFAQTLPLDKQGRINIPQDLKDYASIDRDVVFVGMEETIELWAKSTWDEMTDPDAVDMAELADKVDSKRATDSRGV